ncbi:MAG: hypothetical protein KJ971_04380 [Firmicutes bacterium]|nr:hypothetical protein [Bacillota bacterium]
MNTIKRFVSRLLKDLFNAEDKKELIEILTTSLEEKVEDLVELGTSKEDAIKQSIQEFGSSDDILEAFPKKNEKKYNLLRERKNQFFFSLLGYILIVGLALFFNLTFLDFFGRVYWFVVVIIGVFFWPLAMLYRFLISKK